MSNQQNQRTLYALLGQARELLASQIIGPLPASPVQQNRPQSPHPDPTAAASINFDHRGEYHRSECISHDASAPV